MEKLELSFLDLIVEIHRDLPRQGPGNTALTRRALEFIPGHNAFARVLDLGCGTGGQTLDLAREIGGKITGLDMLPDLVAVLNDNAARAGLADRVNGVVGDMTDLPFDKNAFDLIWSEGAIDTIGFEHGLKYWREFLRDPSPDGVAASSGYVAVTCPTWLTDERPDEIQKFWVDAGCNLDTVAGNVTAMSRAGYDFIAAFVLPDTAWTDDYFAPRTAAGHAILKKYPDNKTATDFIAGMDHEIELYSKYCQYYGYVFYIGRKN